MRLIALWYLRWKMRGKTGIVFVRCTECGTSIGCLWIPGVAPQPIDCTMHQPVTKPPTQ
jgi:hypothetical protein